jgi:predicted small integral membrane protein
MKIILAIYLMLAWAVLMGVVYWTALALFVVVPIGVVFMRMKLSPA